MMNGSNDDPLFQEVGGDDFDEDDLFGAINNTDVTTDTATSNGTTTTLDDDDHALNQQLESMGLGTTSYSTSSVDDREKVAPPPASAPPDAPTSSTSSSQRDTLMHSLMMSDAGTGTDDGGKNNNNNNNSNEEDLFGAIGGSGSGDGEDDLFGIGDDDDDDDDDLFQTTVMEEQQSTSTFQTSNEIGKKTSDDEHGGIVIATAPAANNDDPLSSSIMMTSNQQQRSHNNYYEQQQGNAMMMSYAPTGDESFYRTHNESQFLGIAKSNGGATSNNNYPSNTSIQNPSQQNSQQQRDSIPQSEPSYYNPSNDFIPVFNNVVVDDPKFISEGGGRLLSTLTGGSSSKYWLYTVTSTQSNLPEYKKFIVQRRFRHFDALQERLRVACPGAILPPRPPKHEGVDVTPGSKQNASFALQRASELNLYMRSLIVHPIAGSSEPLYFFLTFVDRDLGTAWPEVSNNALTRLTAGINKTAGEASAVAAASMNAIGNGVNSIQNVATGSTATTYPSSSLSQSSIMTNNATATPSDQNVELAQLLANESHRMNLVVQAIPKVEGCLILLRDVQQAQGVFAMEWSKLGKDMKIDDKPISTLSDIIGLSMLKTSRRNRKGISDCFKILVPLLQQTKLVHMEKLAIQDRQQALEKVWKLKQTHETSQQSFQTQQHIYHTHPMAQQFHAQAEYSGRMLQDATQRADAISSVLHNEIIRTKDVRRQDVFWSLKLFTSTMRDTQKDVTNTWKEALANFEKTFPSSSA